MTKRTDANSKKDTKCPGKEKLSPRVDSEKVFSGKLGYGTGPQRNPDGDGFINPPTDSQKLRLERSSEEKAKKRSEPGKDGESGLDAALKNADEIKSGDIFLKWSEDPNSTHIAIRKDSISMCTSSGLEGIQVKKCGSTNVQGELNVKNLGFQITKGWFTENPLSFIPSNIFTEIPAYLFKSPIGNLLSNGVTEMLQKFVGEFYKG